MKAITGKPISRWVRSKYFDTEERPAICSASPLVPLASYSQSASEEASAELSSEQVLKYPPSFRCLKPFLNVELLDEKRTHQKLQEMFQVVTNSP
jgi:hypothetical protein